MSLPVLGIDIAKDKFDAALLQEAKPRHHQFENKPRGFAKLQDWLQRQGTPQVHACLEATGTYGEALAEFLYQQGHTVSLVNPAQIKAFGESELSRNKTDRSDAGLIARFCRSQQPRPWTPPSPELKELQALTRRLESVKEMRQMEANRLSSGVATQRVRESLEQSLAFFDQEIHDLEAAIQAHIDQHPDLQARQRLLESIQGIGAKTAATLLAECYDPARFDSARALAAFAGVTPQQILSGSSVRGKAKLSKKGSSRLRKALYWPAIVAMRYNPVVRAFSQRLSERGKPRMVQIGAAMRKLLHLAYGVLKSGRPFDPNLVRSAA